MSELTKSISRLKDANLLLVESNNFNLLKDNMDDLEQAAYKERLEICQEEFKKLSENSNHGKGSV